MKQRDVSVWQEERAKEFCEEWYKTQVKKDHKIVVIDDDPTEHRLFMMFLCIQLMTWSI